MRVLMVLGHAAGGIGVHVDRLSRDLEDLGHEVLIATAPSTAARFGWSDASLLWPLRRGARAPWGLVHWHRLKNLAGTVDVVHAHGHQAAVVAAVAVARARPRPALVVSLHNQLPTGLGGGVEARAEPPPARSRAVVAGLVRRVLRWSLRRAALVTGASEDLVDLARRLGVRRAELANVPSSSVGRLLSAPRPTTEERAQQRAGLFRSAPTLGSGAPPGAPPAAPRGMGARVSAAGGADVGAAEGADVGAAEGADVGAAEGLAGGADVAPAGGSELLPVRGGRKPSADPQLPLVLTVARIATQKDLPTLLSAARKLEAPATWVVVGGGDEALRASLESELSGIRLHLVGPQEDVEAWLRAADVFVLTSRWEARALVVQEAMAAGLPVVATRTGGLPDLIGDAGILVPVGDASAVAAAVDRLLSDASLRRQLGAAGRARAAGWASPEEEARRWVGRYTAARSG